MKVTAAKKRAKSRKPKVRKKRQYSDEEKANALLALEANGFSIAKTARQLDIPWQTLDSWHTEKSGIHENILQIRDRKRERIADESDDLVLKVLGILPTAIKKASAQQLGVIYGILVDKGCLLRGEATSITGKQEMTDGEFERRILLLAERIQARENVAGREEGTPEPVAIEAPSTLDAIQGAADPSVLQQS